LQGSGLTRDLVHQLGKSPTTLSLIVEMNQRNLLRLALYGAMQSLSQVHSSGIPIT
jgi:hypothetical protein